MANSICFSGPAFSLSGEQSFTTQQVEFALSFNNGADQDMVKAYQWYLDNEAIINQNLPGINTNVSCGTHTIGARILTAAGWSGIKTLQFKTCHTILSITITGPDSVAEGANAKYSVIEVYTDGTTIDVTPDYTFSNPDGTFSGSVFTPAINNDSDHNSTITATKPGNDSLLKVITITNYNANAGVLVVDIYDNGIGNASSLNVIGLIDDPEIVGNHVAAYKGNNIVPASSAPKDALILASDGVNNLVLKWRFEFNIAQLIINYPANPHFTFYIKGRANAQTSLNGQYGLKTFASQMVLIGSTGNRIPSISGGNLYSPVAYNTVMFGGANGSYVEAKLNTLAKFVYNVALKSVSCVTVVYNALTGPITVAEGATVNYNVIISFSDGSTEDISNKYTFSSPDGTFSGGAFTPYITSGSDHQSTITASKYQSDTLIQHITITSYNNNAGVLVVDIFNIEGLDVIAFIDNTEVTNNHIAAYTGNNTIPSASSPANALILASDHIENQSLRWRFEFNLAKLIINYPASTQFVFYIKGRAGLIQNMNGAYSLKTFASQMILSGNAGGYVPGVLGNSIGSPVTYGNAPVSSGANGSHAMSDLPPIIKFIYHVATQTVTYSTMAINGPDTIAQGASAAYSLIETRSDGTTYNWTSEYIFSSPDGTFTAGVFTPSINFSDTHPSIITASKGGNESIIKQITITNSNAGYAGVLVVDLFYDYSLDVIALINNPEVTGNHIAAYTGSNIVPANAAAEDALILASDLISNASVLKWRFEFNIAKLLVNYPATHQFVFYIKGRGQADITLSGAFVLKTFQSEMIMIDTGSGLQPTVYGSNLQSSVPFQTEIVSGANGSHQESDLTELIRLTYDVPSKTISYNTHVREIQVNDFDFMSVRYHWDTNGGRDLDILVGFENNGTTYDGTYVGFGQANSTVPPGTVPQSNAYLWWGSDNQGSSGFEAVLVGIKKFVDNFPASPNVVEVGLYAVWYGPPVTGDFTVELVTYKGGTMTNDGTNFINTGGQQVSSHTVDVNTSVNNQMHTAAQAYKVGTLKYTKSTQTATIQIN